MLQEPLCIQAKVLHAFTGLDWLYEDRWWRMVGLFDYGYGIVFGNNQKR